MLYKGNKSGLYQTKEMLPLFMLTLKFLFAVFTSKDIILFLNAFAFKYLNLDAHIQILPCLLSRSGSREIFF